MSTALRQGLVTLLLTMLLSLAATAQPLMIYGGKDHKVFLGSLNGSRFDSASIWNQFGDYGSPFNSRSIWNKFGDYGSTFSNTSPWNKYASDPPVIVDQQGNFYGYFTSNRYHQKRSEIKLVKFLVENYDWAIENLDTLRDEMR